MKYATAIWVIKKTNDSFKILLLKRANDDFWCPKMWCLPGGKIDSHESAYHGAIRELYEETGLFIKSLEFVNKEIFNMKDNSNVEINYYIAYLTDVYRTSERAPSYIDLSNEHSDYQWVNVEDVAMYDCVPLLKERTKDTLMPKLNQLT